MRFDLSAVVLALGLAGPVFAEAPSIFDYRLGDHIIDYPLSDLDIINSDLDGFGGQSFIKVNAPNATEVGRVVLDLVRTDLEPDLHLGFLLEIPVMLPVTRGLSP